MDSERTDGRTDVSVELSFPAHRSNRQKSAKLNGNSFCIVKASLDSNKKELKQLKESLKTTTESFNSLKHDLNATLHAWNTS